MSSNPVAAAGSFLRFIRFSHTVFALPFALGSMFVAAEGMPSARVFLGVLACMVFARTAAMTFNRIADWEIDKRNPRTVGRHRLIDRPTAILACAASSVLFLAAAAFLNPVCLALAPVALGIVFFYSLTKRFTHAAQFFLGLALAVAPVGGWLAVRGTFDVPPIVLALGVLFWVAGFDMIYATQDAEVDRREGLYSMVVWLGVPTALRWAGGLHVLAFLLLLWFGISARLGPPYHAAMVLVAGALVFEHWSARKPDVQAVNRAFFWSNAFVGVVFVLGTGLDGLIRFSP